MNSCVSLYEDSLPVPATEAREEARDLYYEGITGLEYI